MYTPTFFVIHFTAGNTSLQNLEDAWIRQCGTGSNSHFGVERYSTANSQPGDIWQWCQLYDGACANCCTETGHAPFLPDGNLNVRTISCEGINADPNNAGVIPQAQLEGYAYLIRTVCNQLGIPTDKYTEYYNGYETTHTWADASGGIIMHRDIAPINRRYCPGQCYYDGQIDEMIRLVNTPPQEEEEDDMTLQIIMDAPVSMPLPTTGEVRLFGDFMDSATVRTAFLYPDGHFSIGHYTLTPKQPLIGLTNIATSKVTAVSATLESVTVTPPWTNATISIGVVK